MEVAGVKPAALLDTVSILAVVVFLLFAALFVLNEMREVLWGSHITRYLYTAILNAYGRPKLTSPLATTLWKTHAVLSSIDLNHHVNNATYNSWLDFARCAWLARLYSSRKAYAATPVHNGGTAIAFLKEIRVWQAVTIATTLHAAGPKWMYLKHVFTCGAVVHAVAVTRVVAKHGKGSLPELRGKTVSPSDLFKLLGYGEVRAPHAGQDVDAASLALVAELAGGAGGAGGEAAKKFE